MNLTRQFTRREKALLLILVVLMIAAGYYLAVYMPVANAVDRLRIEQDNLQLQVQILDERAVQLSQMRTEVDLALAVPNASPIPDYNNLQQLMTFLNTTLTATDDYNLNFQPPEMPQEGDIVRRQLSLAFTCDSYQTARAVITALHESPYRCRLGDLSFDAVDGASIETGAVFVSMGVTFYEIANERQTGA